MADPRTVGIVAHTGKADAAAVTGRLAAALSRHGFHVLIEQATARLIERDDGLGLRAVADRCECLFVLGGDGTILRVVSELGDRLVPVLGINLGSLGFLTAASTDQIEGAVEALISGEIETAGRTMLDVSIHRRGIGLAAQTGLNDAVITRGEISRLVKVDVRIDGVPFTQYHADGLIVATPTGSTAYSLSAGGPIALPGANALLITPICPHVLTNRSVVVSDDSVVEVLPCNNDGPLFLTIDGQRIHETETGDVITIRKSRRRLDLILIEGLTFADLLQAKLKWSGTNI